MSLLPATNFPIKFLTTDLLIVDYVVPCNPALKILLEKYNFTPGSKQSIENEDQIREFVHAIGSSPQRYAGGSASNLLRTLVLLAPDLIRGKFIGATGEDIDGMLIRNAFDKIRDFSGQHPIDLRLITNDIPTKTAISFVVTYPHGPKNDRTNITMPGTAKDVITPDLFTEEMIAQCDYVLLQGSIRKKFQRDVTDTIVTNRFRQKKPLILALPTSAYDPGYFEWMQASANVILSNTHELGFIYKLPIKELSDQLEAEPGNTQLRKTLNTHVQEALRRLKFQQTHDSDIELEKIGFGPQVAMITDDKKGAYLVSSLYPEPILVPAFPDEKITIINKLGVGDNSFAGFIFAKTILGFDDIKAVEFAMQLAAAKLQFNGPVMDDPRQSLRELVPSVSRALDEKLAGLVRANSRH